MCLTKKGEGDEGTYTKKYKRLSLTRRLIYLFSCHFPVAWFIWSESLTNLAVTKVHMVVPRMSWATVVAIVQVCVLGMKLQIVLSSNCTIDTVA